MTSAEIRRQAIEAAAKAIAKITPREGYEDVPLSEIFPTPRARYRFLHEHYIAAADAAIAVFEAALWRPISEPPADRVLVWAADSRAGIPRQTATADGAGKQHRAADRGTDRPRHHAQRGNDDMTNRPYADPGPIERGAYTLGVNGRARFVGSIDGDTVRWGTDPGSANRTTSVGDFKSWLYASRAVRWPGPYTQEVYDPPPIA